MRALRTKRAGAIGASGLTPLLDTLFVLLFALLAASEVRREDSTTELHLELPRVASDEPSSQAEKLRVVLVVDQESIIRLEGEPEALIDGADLDAALAEQTQSSAPNEVTVEIRADREARYGVGVELLQHLRLAGFEDVLLTASGATQPGRAFGEETP